MKKSFLFPVIFLIFSCVTYDPSLYVVETLEYPIPPEIHIPESIESIILVPGSASTQMSTDVLLSTIRSRTNFTSRFKLLPQDAVFYDAYIRIDNSEIRTKEVFGTDKYDSNFLVSLYEFFSENTFTEFDFSLIVEKRFPIDDYYDIYGYRIEQGDVLKGDVLNEEEGYVSRITETGVDTMIVAFDFSIAMYPRTDGEPLYEISSGFYLEYLLYEPDVYDVSAEPGSGGILVNKFPDPKQVLKNQLYNLVVKFGSQLSPGIIKYDVEIHPIVYYEDWPVVYEMMKRSEYDTALEKLLLDISTAQDRYIEASFEYVIGSVYHVLGDFDKALEYLNKSEVNSGFGFGSWVTDQLDQIHSRKR